MKLFRRNKPKLAKWEKLIVCPNCLHNTLLISGMSTDNYARCVNANCLHIFTKEYLEQSGLYTKLDRQWNKLVKAGEKLGFVYFGFKDTVLKEFKVNDIISLKLIDDGIFKTTKIFIKNNEFIQCKFLLLDIPKDNIEMSHDINSIDEAAEKLDHRLEVPFNDEIKIPAETLFWGHCSNLQAWVENEYDTRILHRNIAFPLLKKLTDVGDKTARKRFKEEIAKRYKIGHESVQTYLLKEGYLNYLNEDELESIGLDIDTLRIKVKELSPLSTVDDEGQTLFHPSYIDAIARSPYDEDPFELDGHISVLEEKERRENIMKVVINTDWGGFGLSDKAFERLIELGFPYIHSKDARDENFDEKEPKIVIYDEYESDKSPTRVKYFILQNDYEEEDLRAHPLVVQVVEELGRNADGNVARLRVVEIPDNIEEWRIENYDGKESIMDWDTGEPL